MFDQVIFARRPPGARADRALERALGARDAGGRRLLFLHGDAVTRASGAQAMKLPGGVSVAVCRSSWIRRHDTTPEAPARLATLAELLEALAQAPWLACLGSAGESGSPATPRAAEPLLIEIGFADAGARDRREALEVALAVAALGLDGRVLFSGPGYNHLLTEDARAWTQLTDFELLELVWSTPQPLNVPGPAACVPVHRIDQVEAAKMRAAAGRHLLL